MPVMVASPQVVIAIASCAAVTWLAIGAVRLELQQGSGGLNSVTFLWGGIVYFVGIGAITASVLGNVDHYSIRTSVLGFLAVCTGVIGVSLGASSTLAVETARRLPQGPSAVSKRASYVICILLLLISLTARFLTFGDDFLLGSVTKALPSSWGNYVFDLRHAIVPAGLVAVSIVASHPTRPLEKVLLGVLILICLLLSFLDFSRRPLTLLIVGTIVYLLSRNYNRSYRLRTKWAYVLLGFTILFGLAFLGAALRWLTRQVTGVPLTWATFELVLGRLAPSSISLDAYSVHLACVDWYQHSSDWLWGGSFVQVITNPIPRAWWSGKPETFGFTIAKLMGEYSTNFGPTIFGEGFANFGLLGSALFGWLLGFGARLTASYHRMARTPISLLLASMLSFESFAEVRGDMQGMTTPLVERVVLLVGVTWLVLVIPALLRRYDAQRLSLEAGKR
jgi:hypothetical protein